MIETEETRRKKKTCRSPTLSTINPIGQKLYYRKKYEYKIHAPGGIRTHNPNKQATADPRLRPRGHLNRHEYMNTIISW